MTAAERPDAGEGLGERTADLEAMHDELMQADDDAALLRAALFQMAEDLTRLKVVCTQEHPPKMGSPTPDWEVGTETRHSDGARCVLLHDGDWALIIAARETAAAEVVVGRVEALADECVCEVRRGRLVCDRACPACDEGACARVRGEL